MRRSRHEKLNLKSAVLFHGHLGPFLVLGYRMGVAAIRELKPRGIHDISGEVWTRPTPPESCMLDGIQISSGCTLGKGNLRVRNSSSIRAAFRRNDHTVTLRPTEQVIGKLSIVSESTRARKLAEVAQFVRYLPERELFIITKKGEDGSPNPHHLAG
jgi:formylmethanofuran dehydrogenase subunit E